MEFNDVLRFFKVRKLNANCPSCNKNDWDMNKEEEDFSSYIQLGIASEEKIPVGGRVIPAVVMVCRNCGFVRQMAKKIIERALADEEGK